MFFTVSGSTAYLFTFFKSEKQSEYSPLGSRIIKREFESLPAASIDHLINPATEHDFPLPVFPKTATCLPNNLSGSTETTAFPHNGLVPICTRRFSPFSIIAFNCSSVGRYAGSPTVGKISIPLENSYSILSDEALLE